MVRLKAHERDPRRRVRLSNRPETNGKHRRKKRPILPAASPIPLSLPLSLSFSIRADRYGFAKFVLVQRLERRGLSVRNGNGYV